MPKFLKVFCTTILCLAFVTGAARAQVGSPYCFGSGCPCANDDPAGGCGNAGFDGNPSTGALLDAIGGSADVTLDDLELRVSGVQPGQFGLIVMAGASTNVPLGDGLRCIDPGGSGLFRFPTQQADASGNLNLLGVVGISQNFAGPGQIMAGSTWQFQGWYRDPLGGARQRPAGAARRRAP